MPDDPPATERIALQVEHLTKRFADRVALDDVTFSAPAGAITAVLGPNGAGKSTLVSICVGLHTPDSGAAYILGRRAPVPPGAKHLVGVMLQDGGLPGSARPVPFLRHLASLYDEPADVDDIITGLGIDAYGMTPLRRTSGGQRQRVALAAAMIGRPRVMFLDEPTAGLDVQTRNQVWQVMNEACNRGCAVILTSHDLDEVEHLARRVVVLDRGRVIADDTMVALLGDPTSAPGGLVEVCGTVEAGAVVAATAALQPHLAPGEVAHTRSPHRRRLEDVFLELTTSSARTGQR